jgi:hypothetical protein
MKDSLQRASDTLSQLKPLFKNVNLSPSLSDTVQALEIKLKSTLSFQDGNPMLETALNEFDLFLEKLKHEMNQNVKAQVIQVMKDNDLSENDLQKLRTGEI